ncbi:hypothetical protein, partial [uncultured Clostridium sp.]|uniref:hypothetical protein n=1 Tax=uncultured Clostridium sp. TaxID=59620 RepID=UPI002583C376
QVNIKELAVVLGHSSGIFTMQHYVVPSQKVCEEVPEFGEYTENLIKSSTIGARKIASRKESVAETREIPYNNAV